MFLASNLHEKDGSIKVLPEEVLGRTASSSHNDIFNAKLCCKDFFGATEEKYIYEQISIEKFPVICEWLKSEKVISFLNRCKECGNSEALFRYAMIEYFSKLRTESGLDHLRKAADKGHVESSYVYGIILFLSGEPYTSQGLKILSAIRGAKSVSNNIITRRKRIRAVIDTMWVNNHIVHQHKRLCGHERGNIKAKTSWRERDDVDDDVECEYCRWDKEVRYFCNMLPHKNL